MNFRVTNEGKRVPGWFILYQELALSLYPVQALQPSVETSQFQIAHPESGASVIITLGGC